MKADEGGSCARADQAACAGSWTSASRSSTPTAEACCTAISSRPTLSWARRRDTRGRLGPGQGDRRTKQEGSRRREAAGAVVGQRHGRDAAGLGAGHASLYEPRASRRGPRPHRAAVGRVLLRQHTFLLAHGESSVRRKRRGIDSAAITERGFPAAASDFAGNGWRARGHLLEGDGTQGEDRYESCRALADDVERWTAGEPVSAWREPVLVGCAGGRAGTARPWPAERPRC